MLPVAMNLRLTEFIYREARAGSVVADGG